jgi:glutamate-5-semialdehyde dehydrogenase
MLDGAPMTIKDIAAAAKVASIRLAAVSGKVKNNALTEIARALQENSDAIIQANQKDIREAEKNKIASPLLKRLKFDQDKINIVCEAIESLIKLADPVGQTLSATELDKGLELYKVSCPIGVIGVIFESRPDALVQISTLCLKSGNAVLLKGGSEAANTNRILAKVIAEATQKLPQNEICHSERSPLRPRSEASEESLISSRQTLRFAQGDSFECAGIPIGWIQLLETRADVAEMLKMDDSIDLVIPRGSNEFVRHIMDNTNIPVLGHAEGICHVYIDGAADIDMAVKITVDSKCQYVAVCNAAETLLVDEKFAKKFLPKVKAELDKCNVEIRGCEKTRTIIDAKPATQKDWATEYLDYILSIKVVAGLDEAIEHINKYGSKHTDAIVTNNKATAVRFMDLVDSADVFWNCSTRFSDGYRYGLGAEVGISTNKIHARGPVGLEGLVIYKWKLLGSGQIVADYTEGRKKFTHKKLNH